MSPGESRTVLVTGAGAGIGRATAIKLLADGWRVGAFDIDEENLNDLAQQVGSGRLVTGLLDVRNVEDWRRGLATLCPDGPLDALINNAGILQSGNFEDIPLEDQLRAVDINVKGMLIGCHTAHPYLRRAAPADVVNIASASAIYGQADLATYSATKFAVRGLSEALDLEWSGQGIRVQAIWPLFVRSAMTEGLDIGTTRALGVRLTPEDVAAKIVASLRTGKPTWSIHRPVGLQATASLWGSSVSPSWLLRRVNRGLGGRQ